MASLTVTGHYPSPLNIRSPCPTITSQFLLNQFLLLVINSNSINKISLVSHINFHKILLRPISPSHHRSNESNIGKFRSIDVRSNYMFLLILALSATLMAFNVPSTLGVINETRDKLKLKITRAQKARESQDANSSYNPRVILTCKPSNSTYGSHKRSYQGTSINCSGQMLIYYVAGQ